MSGTCKIVNFSWLLFATLKIGPKPLKLENKKTNKHKHTKLGELVI